MKSLRDQASSVPVGALRERLHHQNLHHVAGHDTRETGVMEGVARNQRAQGR